MFDKLSTFFVDLLNANDLIQSVTDYETSDVEGTPSATVVPSANANVYNSTTENRRTYAFMIRLYYLRGSNRDSERDTEAAMRELVDTVLDDLDKNYNMDALDKTQTGYTFLFMHAAPSQWGYAGKENNYRIAEINIVAEFDIDVTLIS